jgi:hypothetical protein
MAQSKRAKVANYLCRLNFRSPLGSANKIKHFRDFPGGEIPKTQNKPKKLRCGNRRATRGSITMDLSVNLQTVIDVEIDGQSVNLQSVNLDGAKELYIDGLTTSDVLSILQQLWEQYRDLGTDDVVAAEIAAALHTAIACGE